MIVQVLKNKSNSLVVKKNDEIYILEHSKDGSKEIKCKKLPTGVSKIAEFNLKKTMAFVDKLRMDFEEINKKHAHDDYYRFFCWLPPQSYSFGYLY